MSDRSAQQSSLWGEDEEIKIRAGRYWLKINIRFLILMEFMFAFFSKKIKNTENIFKKWCIRAKLQEFLFNYENIYLFN